jgi:SET domain-containing protein
MELRDSPLGGKGLFAKSLIKKGEVVWADQDCMGHGKLLNQEQISALPKPDRLRYLHFAYQVSDSVWLGTFDNEEANQDASYFWNHSCDPTTWFVTDELMEASRDILPGEEITFDYGTMYTIEWPDLEERKIAMPQTIKCLCGTKACRGRVSAEDWKRPELREKYKGRWVPFVQEMIDRESH